MVTEQEESSRFISFKMKLITSFVLIFMLMMTGVQTSYAGNRDTYKIDNMSVGSMFNKTVFSTETGVSDSSTLTLFKESDEIGIDTLYGTNWRSFSYKGEATTKNDKYSPYPKNTNPKIGEGCYRKWTIDPEKLDLEWEDDSTKDLHAYPLVYKTDDITNSIGKLASGVMFSILSGMNYICGLLTNFLIMVANLDVAELFGKDNTFVKDTLSTISKILLVKDGQMSPLFVLALALWIIGMLGVLFRFAFRGTGSLREGAKEIGMMLISFALVAVATTGSISEIYSTLTTGAQNLASSVANPGSSDEDDRSLFTYTNEDATTRTTLTQIAMTKKPYIDAVIKSEFGMSPDKLNLSSEEADEIWGTDENLEELAKSVASVDPNGDSDDTQALWISKNNGKIENYNLGYYFYAVCSNVGTHVDTSESTIDSEGKIKVAAEQERLLLIPDILAAIDQKADGSDRAKDAMKHIMEPTADFGSMFGVTLVSSGLAFAILMASIYALFGKIVFTGGMIFMPLIPILVAIPTGNFRRTALQMAKTWMVSLLKMVVGLAFITIVLTISATLCELATDNGALYLIDFMLLIIIGIFGPKIFVEINNTVGRDQMGFASTFDRQFNNAANKLSNNRRNNLLHPIANRRQRAEEMKNKAAQLSTTQTQALADELRTPKESNVLSNFAGLFGGGDGELAGEGSPLSMEKLGQLNDLEDETNNNLAGIAALTDADIVKENGDIEYAKAIEDAKKAKEDYYNSAIYKKIIGNARSYENFVEKHKLLSKLPVISSSYFKYVKLNDKLLQASLDFSKIGRAKKKAEKNLGIIGDELTTITMNNGELKTVSKKDAVKLDREERENKIIDDANKKAKNIIFGRTNKTDDNMIDSNYSNTNNGNTSNKETRKQAGNDKNNNNINSSNKNSNRVMTNNNDKREETSNASKTISINKNMGNQKNDSPTPPINYNVSNQQQQSQVNRELNSSVIDDTGKLTKSDLNSQRKQGMREKMNQNLESDIKTNRNIGKNSFN